MMVEKKW